MGQHPQSTLMLFVYRGSYTFSKNLIRLENNLPEKLLDFYWGVDILLQKYQVDCILEAI